MKIPAARLRLAVGALAGLALLAALLLSRWSGVALADWSGTVTRWAASAGPAGWLIFAAAQAAVAMVGIVPASLLGIAAGGVYGFAGGFALATVGTLVGGFAAFLLARSLLRPTVARLLERRLRARGGQSRLGRLDAAVARDGWRFVCLLRASPVMPFALTSYALGLTEISNVDYLLGTLAALPALAGYVGIGALAQYGLLSATGSVQSGPLTWILIAVGLATTTLLILRTTALLSRSGLLPRARPTN